MLTRQFWLSAIERAVKSFAQALVALLSVGGMGLFDASWSTLLSTAGMAALLSILTSLASERIGTPNDPSMLRLPRGQGAVTTHGVLPAG